MRASARKEEVMGEVYSFRTRRPVEPDLDALTAEDIWQRWEDSCDTQEVTEEGKRFHRAWKRALRREEDAVEGQPDDALVSVWNACKYLNVTDQAVRNWIYRGVLTGTRLPRGACGCAWRVPVAELRRLRLEQDERITRERAWMQEPSPALPDSPLEDGRPPVLTGGENFSGEGA